MKSFVVLLLLLCLLPAISTAKRSNGGKNQVSRQDSSTAGAETNILNTLTNLVSALPTSLLLLLLIIPLAPLLLVLAGAGPAVSALANTGLGALGAASGAGGAVANAIPGLLAAGTGTAAAVAANPGYYYRTQRSAGSGGESSFWDILTTVDEALRKYEVSDRECQLRLTCEVHRQGVSPSTGSFAEKLIQAFGVENRLARSSFSKDTKTAMNDFLKAARYGMAQKDCAAIYIRCPEY